MSKTVTDGDETAESHDQTSGSGNISAPAACPQQRYAVNGVTMGTRYSATFYAPAQLDVAPIEIALRAAVGAVDDQMSTWKPESDLCRFNAAPPGVWVEVPAELLAVVEVGIAIGMASGGAFDIGVGDAVNAWGFGPGGRVPDAGRISRATAGPSLPASATLEIDVAGSRLRKHAPVSLDLSGIAKGFGVDQLSGVLQRAGIRDHVVSIDGEIRAHGRKADGTPWRVAVEQPDRTARTIARIVSVSDRAIATSGDYRHRVEHEGGSVSHTVDPRTRRPVGNALASVTVLASTCCEADAWATALMVLGERHGPALAIRRNLDALFLIREGRTMQEITTGRSWR